MRRRSPSANCTSAANSLATVVVLPVPGPPEIIAMRRVAATAAAIFCQSGSSVATPNNRSRMVRSCASSSSCGTLSLLIKVATSPSLCHMRCRYSRCCCWTIGVAVLPSLTAGDLARRCCQLATSGCPQACQAARANSGWRPSNRFSGNSCSSNRQTWPAPASELRQAAASRISGSSSLATTWANCTSSGRKAPRANA